MKLKTLLEFIKNTPKDVLQIYLHMVDVKNNKRPLMKELLWELLENGIIEIERLGDAIDDTIVFITDKGLKILKILSEDDQDQQAFDVHSLVHPDAASDLVEDGSGNKT